MDGIIIVNKEKGFTSHDCVAKMRGILQQKKIGHTGTLDPDATGVLPICLGKATKVCDLLTDRDKEYVAELRLGFSTTTQDITGERINEAPVNITPQEFHSLLSSFIGQIEQIPPMYSAIKVNGKHLYELARKGVEIERKSRKIEISELEVLEEDWDNNRIKLRIRCSKGTYIRTLCHDIGLKAGCYGTMESLVRTRVGEFSLEDSYTLSEIEQNKHDLKILHPIDSLFMDRKELTVKEEAEKYLFNGNTLNHDEFTSLPEQNEGEEFRIYDHNHNFCALYRYAQEAFIVVKMFR